MSLRKIPNCPGSKEKKTYEDNVRWKWKILSGGGKFINDEEGRTVIYEAVKKMPSRKEFVEVKIEVEISQSGEFAGDR